MLAPKVSGLRLSGDQRGYEPIQPIEYSHRLHAGELEIPCLYCHFGAEKSRHAGIPPANVCMNCHGFITASWGAIRAEDRAAEDEDREPRRIVSPELQKLYDALALDENMQPEPLRSTEPIEWIRIHHLPDFAYFDHRSHVKSGIQCQVCHGPVETMERVRQVESMNMGWCVNCHRGRNMTSKAVGNMRASDDCITCHF